MRRRAIQAVGLQLVMAATGICAQKAAEKGTPPAPPPPKAAPQPKAMPKGGGGGRNLGPRITNPGSLAARLYLANPEERERAIEKLPPARQAAIRENLKWFDNLPGADKQVILQRAERFANLTPDQQRHFQQQMQAWSRLPQDRKIAIGVALRLLQTMPDQQRINTLNRPAFRARFSPEEWQMISDLSEVMLPPM